MLIRSKVWVGAVAMLALPLVFLILLRVVASMDARFFSPNAHLVFVGGIALCASMIALAAAVSSRKATHPGLAHLSIGAASVGILMLGHGLTTPGVLSQPPNPWVGRFPHLALTVFTVTLFLAGQRVDNRWCRWVTRHSTAFVVSSVVAVGAFTAYATFESSLWTPPAWEENALDVLSYAIVGVSLVVVIRHWQRWQLGRDVVQLALTFAAAMTIAAVTSLQHGKFQQLSWWDYHAYLLAGFGCAVFAILVPSPPFAAGHRDAGNGILRRPVRPHQLGVPRGPPPTGQSRRDQGRVHTWPQPAHGACGDRARHPNGSDPRPPSRHCARRVPA